MRQIGREIQSWPLLKLLVKTGHTWTHGAVLLVNLTEGGNTGRGEASDVDCLGEPDESMYQQVLGLQKQQEQGGGLVDGYRLRCLQLVRDMQLTARCGTLRRRNPAWIGRNWKRLQNTTK